MMKSLDENLFLVSLFRYNLLYFILQIVMKLLQKCTEKVHKLHTHRCSTYIVARSFYSVMLSACSSADLQCNHLSAHQCRLEFSVFLLLDRNATHIHIIRVLKIIMRKCETDTYVVLYVCTFNYLQRYTYIVSKKCETGG